MMMMQRAGSSDKAATPDAAPTADQSLKLAAAVSLLRSKLLRNSNSVPESDALRWKRKAKERKQELLQLRKDLKEAQDNSSRFDLFSQSAQCKCYFYNNLGKLSPKLGGDCSDRRISDVLRRRFIRQVRFKERRKKDGPSRRRQFSELNSDDEVELLRASVDFLVDLCDTASPMQQANFANWSHQAVDFIIESMRNLLPTGKNRDIIEEIVENLVMGLIKRMCFPSQADESHMEVDAQFYVQHLIRKLGSDLFIGQRAMLSVSVRISMVAENLLFLDPFDDAFPKMHECLYLLIQLVEFLLCDYLPAWLEDKHFDSVVFEEWVISLAQGRKALQILENRNGIYMVYMDRVVGQLAKQISSLQNLNKDILANLFC